VSNTVIFCSLCPFYANTCLSSFLASGVNFLVQMHMQQSQHGHIPFAQQFFLFAILVTSIILLSRSFSNINSIFSNLYIAAVMRLTPL